jgi:uncharacterized protein YndB with AHSA1/START domain
MSEIEQIIIVRETPATVEAAWDALTLPELVERWLTQASPISGGVGTPYRLDFGDSATSGVITEIVPGRRLAYTWAWEDAEPRQETLVSWELERLADDGCRVTLHHGGWDAADDETARDDHAGYWQGYLDDLVDLLAGDPRDRGDPGAAR